MRRGWSPHLPVAKSIETIDSDDTEDEDVEEVDKDCHANHSSRHHATVAAVAAEESKDEADTSDVPVPQWFASEEVSSPLRRAQEEQERVLVEEQRQLMDVVRRREMKARAQPAQPAQRSWTLLGGMVKTLLTGSKPASSSPPSPPPPPAVAAAAATDHHHRRRRSSSSKRRFRAPSSASSTNSSDSETSSGAYNHAKHKRMKPNRSKPSLGFFVTDNNNNNASLGSHHHSRSRSRSRSNAPSSISISGGSDSSDDDDAHDDSIKSGDPHTSGLSLQKPSVYTSKTFVCGQPFGKSHLVFAQDQLQLTVRNLDEEASRPVWKGAIPYQDILALRLDERESHPHVLLLEIRRDASFHEFYDFVFAHLRQAGRPTPRDSVYGALFTFQTDMSFATCRSAADLSSTLQRLFSRPLSHSESSELISASRIYELDGSVTRSLFDGTRTSNGIALRRSPRIEDKMAAFRESMVPFLARRATDLDTSLTRHDRDQHQERNGSFSEVQGSPSRPATVSSSSSVQVPVPVPVPAASTRSSSSSSSSSSKQNTSPKSASACCECSCWCCGRPKKLGGQERAKVLLQYPFDETDPGGISLTCGDFERLYPGEFLNDNLIDFYFQYLSRHLQPEQQAQIHFFSTHFFTQVMGFAKAHTDSQLQHRMDSAFQIPIHNEHGSQVHTKREKRLLRLLRWTNSMPLFDKKLLFIPINDSFHWSLAVVCNVGGAIVKKPEPDVVDLVHESQVKTEDSQADHEDDAIAPCILFLDSLQCHRKKTFCNLLRGYLEKEFVTRFGWRTNLEFDSSRLPMVVPEVPLQDNMVDCGVFVLMYAVQVLSRLFPNAETNFCTREHIAAKFRSLLDRKVFDLDHVQSFRHYLQQLIYCLQSLQLRGDTENAIRQEGLEHFSFDGLESSS